MGLHVNMRPLRRLGRTRISLFQPMPRPSSTLHLALPGLLWPAQALQDMVFDLKLPALSWLLGKGNLSVVPVSDSGSWLAQVAGLPAWPAAALRVAASGSEQTGRWLCLDPIHLRVERTQLIVQDPTSLQLTRAEAEALCADLAPLLAELGTLHVADTHAWHLHLHAASDIRTTPLTDAIGLNGDLLMPQADNIRLWRRLLNEIQITLHTHPVNEARTARGLPAANSLWPWGEGRLDTHARPNWTRIEADGLAWQGLARQIDCAWSALPSGWRAQAGTTLSIQPCLANAARDRNAIAWLAAMQALEQDWFVPLQAALCSGQLDMLVIHGHGEGQALRLQTRASDRFRFWRPPAALTTLGVAAS